jgi:hypothetical protein
MTRFVVLSPATDTDVSLGFDVRIGPLAFVCLADALDETLGEALEAVGAVLTPAEPRPRPLEIVLPVRGTGRELDPREAGYRLRRQLRQLLENPRILSSGLYFHWEADPELDGWLRFGGGKLADTEPGVTFGEWRLELTDCYRVGTPASSRRAMRLELGDRRTGLVALDTRGTLYSTDHAAQALPTQPLTIPGDVASILLAYNRPPASTTAGPQRATRRLWRTVAAADGDVASYLPDESILTVRGREYLDLEAAGAVRVWDTEESTVNVADPSQWTTARDADPTIMGWERVYGPSSKRSPELAIDNGVCRLVWLGVTSGEGLALELYDDAAQRFVRIGRLAGATDVREVTIVELTLERVVVEWRGAERAMRAILCRGWRGPRLEAYNDAIGGTARLEYVAQNAGAITATPQAVAWVEQLTSAAGGTGPTSILWAKGTDADARATFAGAGTFLAGPGVSYSHAGAVVAQLGDLANLAVANLAALAVADARAVPVLIAR